jgi:hypothetical protein
MIQDRDALMRRKSNRNLHHPEQPRGVRRLLHGGLALLGIAWAAPLTLVGGVFAVPILLCRGRGRLSRELTPALIVTGPLADYLLKRHPFGVMSAMAIGHIVIIGQGCQTRQILTHELTHVRQAALWGSLFPIAYGVSSLWAVLRGRDIYWHNAFEIAAREAEQHS